MSFAERSARSKALAAIRRRDRRKRFANEFGRLRGFFSKGDGTMFSEVGQIVGAVPNENAYRVEFDGSNPLIPAGIYKMDAAKSENVKAVLSKRALNNAKNVSKPNGDFDKFDQDSAVNLDEFLKTRTDGPDGWTKNKDGSFTSNTGNTRKEITSLPKGDFLFEGAGENNEQDLGEPLYEIRDRNGDLIGVAQDWAGTQKISLTHDQMKGDNGQAPKDTTPSEKNKNADASSIKAGDKFTFEGEEYDALKDHNFYTAPDDHDVWGVPVRDKNGKERLLEIGQGQKVDVISKGAKPESSVVKEATLPKTTSEKSKPSYLDQKPKQYQSTLKKEGNGYSTGPNDAADITIEKDANGIYTVNHGYNYMRDENSGETRFDDGSMKFETQKEALDFANKKLEYYNSYRVDKDAEDNMFFGDGFSGDEGRPMQKATVERGLGQDTPKEEPTKPLSEKQMEPATPKQYALLKEFQEERDGIDENQNQAINDAIIQSGLQFSQ